jgi:superfamily II DNA/RNA helicase
MTEEKATFTDLGLGDLLLKALDEVGYKHPTPIQEQAIPYVLMGRDVIGVAQTGTGKTASFTLPLLEILKTGKAKSRMPRALILAPTRELAAQIQENLKQYSQKTNITSTLLVGGEAMNEQAAQLQRGVDIVIATPGRFMDQFGRGGMILTDTKFFIIDEADRMLDMGFIPDIEKIVGFLPKIRQTLMFTATMGPEIRKLADKFLSNPKEITVARSSSTATTISQFVYETTPKQKAADILAIISELKPTSMLVFCNRKTDVEKVKTALNKKGLNAEGLHGDMAQSQRYASLDRFKAGESKIIICSDIAARGLDIDDVSHVLNYDVPRHAEDYVHRIGRTGRAGKSGFALTFITAEDEKGYDAITKLIEQKIPVMPRITKLESAPVQKIEPAAKPPVQQQVQQQSQPNKKLPIRHKTRQKIDDDELDDEKTLGFGDELPAFMRNGL